MPTYKAIKMILRHRPERNFESPYPDVYPAFVANPAAFEGMRPHDYAGRKGVAGHTDKVSNLGTGADTGAAVWLLPSAAADEILALGHPDITQITETELEDFWDNRSHVYEPDTFDDEQTLRAIKAKRDLGIPESSQDLAALDPDDETLGIRKNHTKTWKRFKTKRGITVL